MTPAPSSPVALLDQLDELLAAGTADGPWRLVDHDDRHGPENRYEILDDERSVAVCSDDNDSTETTGAQRSALIVGSVNAIGPLAAAVRAVLELHKPWGIYTECDHDHQDENEPGVVEIDMVGLTCREGLMYEVCVECCIEDGPFEQFQFEHCADHHEHGTGKPICKTVAALTAALLVIP